MDFVWDFCNFLTTECVTNIDFRNEMIIFGSLWTTFEASVNFWRQLEQCVDKIGKSLKPNNPRRI